MDRVVIALTLVLALAAPLAVPLPAEAGQPPTLPPAEDRPAALENLLQQIAHPGGPVGEEAWTPVVATAEPANATPVPAESPPEPEGPPEPLPILATPVGRVVPFGHRVPRLTCIPDRVCDVVLEAGEVIDNGPLLGDTEHWQITAVYEGRRSAPRPVLALRVTGWGHATNLLVATDRRTYRVELVSPRREDVEDGDGYDQSLAFHYPEPWPVPVAAPPPVPEPVADPKAAAGTSDAAALDFGFYAVEPAKKRRRLGWRPRPVFADGRDLYLGLPAAGSFELPAVLEVTPAGDEVPLEARVDPAGRFYVVSPVVGHLRLVLGSGKSRRFLDLYHRTPREARP